jgi:hypothetical protein
MPADPNDCDERCVALADDGKLYTKGRLAAPRGVWRCLHHHGHHRGEVAPIAPLTPEHESEVVRVVESHDFDPLTCPPIAGDFHGPHGPLPAPSPSPQWGRASTGAPYSSYTWHRWREGAGEAECGETCDGEIVYSEPEPESTCEDCRASETGEVQPEPELAARIAEDAEAGRKTAIEPPAKPPRKPRAPRVCCGPSCTAPGKTAKNASGAKVARSAYLCEAHMRFAETDPALVRAWAGQRAQTAIPGTTEAA